MANPQVIVAGIDLWDKGYVKDFRSVSQQKSYQKDKLTTNSYSFEARNFDDFFSINNNDSIFVGTDWLYEDVLIKDRNSVTIWDGVLTGITRNHDTKIATIHSRDKLFTLRNRIIEYESSDWETIGDAFVNLCTQEGFTTYEKKIAADSIINYTANSCYVKVNINLSDKLTFQQACEKFGEYGNANVFMYNNIMYFDHWVPFSGTADITITDDDFKKKAIVYDNEKDMINDYSIGYYSDNDVPATDLNTDNIGINARNRYGTKSLPELRSSEGQIIFKDKPSASYIGQGAIKRSVANYSKQARPIIGAQFDLFVSKFRDFIDLNTYASITFSDEEWNNKVFEINSFGIDEESDTISITVFEAT